MIAVPRHRSSPPVMVCPTPEMQAPIPPQPPSLAHPPPPPPPSASLGRYACRVLQQAHRQEIITGLKDATQALLLNFYRRSSGKKPTALIYYR